ncbi:MAG: hypothetical protein AAF771_05940 [Pseudomonadota bacterium]
MTTGTDAAADTTKQLLTLSTAIIGLTVTFLDKFRPVVGDGEAAQIAVVWQVKVCWIAFGAVIFLGMWTLMAITGEINDAAKTKRTPDAMSGAITIPAICMVVGFGAGMVFLIWSGFAQFR